MKRWVWLIPVALAFVTRWPALNAPARRITIEPAARFR